MLCFRKLFPFASKSRSDQQRFRIILSTQLILIKPEEKPLYEVHSNQFVQQTYCHAGSSTLPDFYNFHNFEFEISANCINLV